MAALNAADKRGSDMSMLEREIQDVELDGVDTAEVDSDDTGRKDDESAFEKALSRRSVFTFAA